MIRGLHIENIAVVKNLDIDLCGGLNVLTGETGAGKSIIIDSLNLLLGSRADRELIRRGEDTALVSALFEDIGENTERLLSELGFECEDGCVMISRTVTAEGRSVARINGRSVTLSVMKEIASSLFNIHGQNDNQQIMRASSHIDILDVFAKNEELLGEYSTLYKEMLHIKVRLDSLKQDSMEKNRLREMLSYQIEDIDAARLKAGEEDALLAEEKKLLGLERVNKCITLVRRAISGSEKGAGASYMCDRAAQALTQISDAYPEAKELAERLESVRFELDDIADSADALSDFGRSRRPSLNRMLLMELRTVPSDRDSSWAISLLDMPLPTVWMICHSLLLISLTDSLSTWSREECWAMLENW